MIETMEAVQNLEEILSVPGISGVYVGPNDLALSMGLPPQLVSPNLIPAEPVLEQIFSIFAKVRAAGKLAGIACGSPTMVAYMQKAGFHLTTLCSDVHFFRTGMQNLLAETRAALCPA
jgi:4-hydroxy-2-oxoheptanedioate aldolase